MTWNASELADRLFAARSSGKPIARLEARLRPVSADDGYAVQAAVRSRVGGTVAGYKIGLTSAGARQAFAAAEPIAGTLAPGDVIVSPAEVSAGPLPMFAEAEIVFVIGEAFNPGDAPFSAAQARARIARVHAGIELCATRYAWEEPTLAELIADNANAERLIVGAPLPDWRGIDLADLTVILSRHGHDPIAGSTGAVLGDPVLALMWLANWLAERGETLEAGSVVASGSCTGVVELGDNERLVATVAGRAEANGRILRNMDKG